MGFFIAMFLCNLLMPLIMLIGGYCMYKNPPKEINGLVGYRTTMSKKNKDTWKFAHDYCGRLWIKLGFILLIPTILVQIPFVHSSENAIGIVALIFIMYSCLKVAKMADKNFENRRRDEK